jgi:hypothetical protein
MALLAGGAAAAAELTGSASPAGPTGQAAQLNSMLNAASSPASVDAASSSAAGSPASASTPQACLNRASKLKASGHPYAAQAVLRFCGHPLRQLRLLGGLHGQFTFETKSGPRTLAYERGVIESLSGGDVVVQATDGTTWTWILESNTVVRENRQRVGTSALSDGENVFAGGPVVSGAYDARLIVIRPSSSTPSPSPTSGS